MRGIMVALSLLLACCSSAPNWTGDITFIGEVLHAETDGKLIDVDGEKYVILKAVFRVIDIKSASVKREGEIEIEYHIMRTSPDIESLKVDPKSLCQLLSWEFHKGNWLRVVAEYLNGKHVDKIYSVQELLVDKWYD
jgi:hypothetical protein